MTAENLELLFAGKIPAIRIPDFAAPQECQSVVEALARQNMGQYQDVDPPIGLLGLTVFEYGNADDPDSYFAQVAEAERRRDEVLGDTDLLERLKSRIGEASGQSVRTARESGRGDYFAGVFRTIEGGTHVHIDYAASEQPGWEVSRVVAQLAWNLYLHVDPVSEGCIHVWDQQWEPADQELRLPASYGFHEEVLRTDRQIKLVPTPGTMLIFNTRNYHSVDPINGNRLALASFMGKLSEGDVLFWS